MSRIGASLLLHGEVLTVDEVLARIEASTGDGARGGGRAGRGPAHPQRGGPFDADDFESTCPHGRPVA